MQHGVDRLAAHHFFSRRTRFDVAVNASKIAVTAHVDLKNIDRAPAYALTGETKVFCERSHGFSIFSSSNRFPTCDSLSSSFDCRFVSYGQQLEFGPQAPLD